MFPDHEDVKRILGSQGKDRALVKTLWPDVVLVQCWLNMGYRYCRQYGRHAFVPMLELKKIAEAYLGKAFSTDVVSVAMCLLPGISTKNSSRDNQILAKFPPLARFVEAREQWDQRRVELDREIQAELEQINIREARRAKLASSS
jgi:hypothetical protein